MEDVYTDQENTDKPAVLKSCKHAPYVISVGLINLSKLLDILDSTPEELNCVDQILHIAVDKQMRIHAVEQSKGANSNVDQISHGIPANLFLAGNLQNILENRIN